MMPLTFVTASEARQSRAASTVPAALDRHDAEKRLAMTAR